MRILNQIVMKLMQKFNILTYYPILWYSKYSKILNLMVIVSLHVADYQR